jgi:translation initiation factor 1
VNDDRTDLTGLPDDLGLGEDLARSEQSATISVESRRYGKPMTVVSGLDPTSTDLDALASTLKSHLAVGGTVTDGCIELQGEHDRRLRDALEAEGFQVT